MNAQAANKVAMKMRNVHEEKLYRLKNENK